MLRRRRRKPHMRLEACDSDLRRRKIPATVVRKYNSSTTVRGRVVTRGARASVTTVGRRPRRAGARPTRLESIIRSLPSRSSPVAASRTATNSLSSSDISFDQRPATADRPPTTDDWPYSVITTITTITTKKYRASYCAGPCSSRAQGSRQASRHAPGTPQARPRRGQF